MENKKLLISSFLIVFSFFLGYTFAQKQSESEVEKLERKVEYVNIIIKKKTLDFITSSPQIKVLINGQESATGSITLE